MSQKLVEVPGIGNVLLARRRGSRSLRLSVTSKGVVRVNMPPWTPYSSGKAFANAHKDWLRRQLDKHQVRTFQSGDRVGKAHYLRVECDPKISVTHSRVVGSEIRVKTPLPTDSPELAAKIILAVEKSLTHQARELLPSRLENLAIEKGFSYKKLRIKKLASRWGSCSSDTTITLSIYLIQLPWHLIDYVLIHELLHTRHMNHSPAFWADLEELLPGAKAIRRQINQFQPRAGSLPLA